MQSKAASSAGPTAGRRQQVRRAQQYKATTHTPLWTWAWSHHWPPQQFRVNIPIHTVRVADMLARWQRHPLVKSADRRVGKAAGDHYSMYDLELRLKNNAVMYCGVSTNADPPDMQHVWLQFLAGTGPGFEKRIFAANILCELLHIESPFPPAIGGVFPKASQAAAATAAKATAAPPAAAAAAVAAAPAAAPPAAASAAAATAPSQATFTAWQQTPQQWQWLQQQPQVVHPLTCPACLSSMPADYIWCYKCGEPRPEPIVGKVSAAR